MGGQSLKELAAPKKLCIEKYALQFIRRRRFLFNFPAHTYFWLKKCLGSEGEDSGESETPELDEERNNEKIWELILSDAEDYHWKEELTRQKKELQGKKFPRPIVEDDDEEEAVN